MITKGERTIHYEDMATVSFLCFGGGPHAHAPVLTGLSGLSKKQRKRNEEGCITRGDMGGVKQNGLWIGTDSSQKKKKQIKNG